MPYDIRSIVSSWTPNSFLCAALRSGSRRFLEVELALLHFSPLLLGFRLNCYQALESAFLPFKIVIILTKAVLLVVDKLLLIYFTRHPSFCSLDLFILFIYTTALLISSVDACLSFHIYLLVPLLHI